MGGNRKAAERHRNKGCGGWGRVSWSRTDGDVAAGALRCLGPEKSGSASEGGVASGIGTCRIGRWRERPQASLELRRVDVSEGDTGIGMSRVTGK